MKTKRKILIVDDEQDILEFLSYNFKKQGFEVITAENGRRGIVRARVEQPDLVISDLLMPEMDGIDFCTVMKKDPKLQDIQFLVLTAVSDDYKVLHAMSVGADQYASKPIRFPYLLSLVNQMLLPQEV